MTCTLVHRGTTITHFELGSVHTETCQCECEISALLECCLAYQIRAHIHQMCIFVLAAPTFYANTTKFSISIAWRLNTKTSSVHIGSFQLHSGCFELKIVELLEQSQFSFPDQSKSRRGGTYNSSTINNSGGDTDPGLADRPAIYYLTLKGFHDQDFF